MGDDTSSTTSTTSTKKDRKGDDEDERLEFLLNYLTKSMRLKQDKWNKMIGTEEYKVSES